MSTCILWFRNNLRLGDNTPVAEAYSHYSTVIPVYIDEDSWHNTRWVEEGKGDHRLRFLTESLADLNDALRNNSSELLVLRGVEPIKALLELAAKTKATAIYAPKEFAYNERKVEFSLRERAKDQGITVHLMTERTLYLESDLPFGVNEIPEVFSRFRGKVEKRSRVQPPIEEPDVSSFDSLDFNLSSDRIQVPNVFQDQRSAVPFNGGTIAAWRQLDFYLWESKQILEYKQTRNGMVGRNYSSKFSAFLALGCISARQIYDELQRFEEEIKSNESTYWLFFELLWREYFQWIALKHGKNLFSAHGLQRERPIRQGFNARAFEKWTSGNTGDSLVDANMKELAATGFMSNRGRQNVASYLVHDMGIDWRAGAAFFEKHLIDYDPASNYGNWLYNAGRGNDPRPFRKFDTKIQAERYDPKGEFIEMWT
ncbi:MAG TPA: cryptochrome DASH [Cryomorphaceae bacterium]|nr:cryptochrome DASH [Cryomorphaceae bacterium]